MGKSQQLSSSAKVLDKMPTKICANEVDLSIEYLPSMKTLRLFWITKEDQFIYYSVPIEALFQYTERYSLRNISPLFDPLGFLAKVLMQNVWVSRIDWDKKLNKECKGTAVKWFRDLNELQHNEVKKSLVSSGKRGYFSFYVFTDASEKAYGTAVYARCVQTNREIAFNIVISNLRLLPQSQQAYQDWSCFVQFLDLN